MSDLLTQASQRWGQSVDVHSATSESASLREPHGGPYDGGGGDGQQMLERIEKLENEVKALNTSALQIAMDTAYLRGKAEDMPTKDWFNTRLIAVVGISTGIIALVIALS